jgi:thiamine biosynthesis lipoprotein
MSFEGNTLLTKARVILDFGAAGKGYAIDLISEVLKSHGYKKFIVDAGGDMFISETESRIGLEDPNNSDQVIGVAALSNSAIAGSSGNRRKWGNYHHIMNPKTLKSVTEVNAVWVIADTAMLADGLATALFFVNPEIIHQFSFEYLIINYMNKIKLSSGFPAELFGE